MRLKDAVDYVRPKMEEIENEKIIDALKQGTMDVQVVKQYAGKPFPYSRNSGTDDPIQSINWAIQFLKDDKILAKDFRLSAQAYDLLTQRLENEAFGTAKEFENRDPLKVMTAFIIGYACGVGKCIKNVGDDYQ